jgi:branched-chain amino acid transport system permease protein
MLKLSRTKRMVSISSAVSLGFMPAYPSLTPYTGSMPGIKAFVAAVFGGIGSIPGAFIGGVLLGVIEILSKAYISSQLSDAIVFSVLIIVLLVKPTGILGKKISEKV